MQTAGKWVGRLVALSERWKAVMMVKRKVGVKAGHWADLMAVM